MKIHDWYAESGEYTVEIGASGRDIRLSGSVQIESRVEIPINFTYESTVGDLLKTAKGRAFVEQMTGKSNKEEIDSNSAALGEGSEKMAQNMSSEYKMTYDEAGNILSVDIGSEHREYEGYDANGNWSVCTYFSNGEIGCFLLCEYNDRGDMVTKSFGIGSDSRMVAYNYDEKGRLNDIRVDDTVLYQFAYSEDGLMERVEKVNEYKESESETEEGWGTGGFGYVLEQEIRSDLNAYIRKYIGINRSDIDYCDGAVSGSIQQRKCFGESDESISKSRYDNLKRNR